MTTLEKIRKKIAEKIDYNNGMISIESVLQIIDKCAKQEQETTVSILSDENGYYPNVCGMCVNAESELCEWCGDNKNFKKAQTKIPDSYKKYAEQVPTDRIEYGTDGNAYKLWISNGKEFEQEPCDDVVSRQAALNTINAMRVACDTNDISDYYILLLEAFKQLPSVRTQEPCSNCCDGNQIEKAKLCQKSYLAGIEHKQELMREFTEEEAKAYSNALDKMYKPTEFNVFDVVNTPWIYLDNCANSGYYCPKCKKKLVKDGWSETVKKINFCPYCGAKMVKSWEREK